MLDNPEIKRYIPAVIITFGCIVLFIFVFWLVSPKFESYTIQKTPFRTDSFVTLRGNELYAYSGNSFYKVSLDKNNFVNTLSRGARLPAIRSLDWVGDDGALLVFDDAQSDASILEESLAEKDLTINSVTIDFVWYFRFSDNTLHLVTENPLATNVYYAADEAKLFFSGIDTTIQTEAGSKHDDPPHPLWSFDTKKLTTKRVIDDIGVRPVIYIGPCSKGSVCAIQEKDTDNQVLWTVDHNKKKKILEYNTITPTNDPNIFIGEKSQPFENSATIDESGEDGELQMDTYIANLSADSERKTGITVNYGADIAATIERDNETLTFTDTSFAQRNHPIYLSITPDIFGAFKSRQTLFTSPDKKEVFSEGISHRIVVNRDGTSLLADPKGNVYIMSKDTSTHVPEQYNKEQLNAAIKKCLDKYTEYHQYAASINTMTAGVLYDDKFRERIRDFSDCIEKTDKNAFVAQNYIFHGVSPIDGRLVTN